MRQGAFTGADRKRIGKFEQCKGGTIFLDEIGDMPLSAQAKILRVLQEQRFERVGGSETVQTQVRVLAATNQDLEKRIVEGKFRSDLFYRLRVVSIRVPPLRDRAGDVAELAHHFLFAFNRELGLSYQGIDPETLAFFQSYSWPGNVRELQGVLKEAMLRGTGPLLLPHVLPTQLRAPRLRRSPRKWTRTGSTWCDSSTDCYGKARKTCTTKWCRWWKARCSLGCFRRPRGIWARRARGLG